MQLSDLRGKTEFALWPGKKFCGLEVYLYLSANEVSPLQKSHLGEQLSSPTSPSSSTLSIVLPLPGKSDKLSLF